MTIANADISERTAGFYAGGRTAGAAFPAKAPPGFSEKEADNFNNVLKTAQRNEAARTAGSTVAVQSAPGMSEEDGNTAEGDGGFIGFIKGVLDVINPLQHLPVISTIYRHITGDEISPAARIAGDTLYGGPIGLAMGVVNVAVAGNTGKDIGETVLAMAFDGDKQELPTAQTTEIAAPVMMAAADIIWNAPQDTPAAENPDQPYSDQHGTMFAMDDPQEILSAVTPTHLRTRSERMDEPVKSLPYAPPVHTAKKGMLAPTGSTQVVSGAGLTAAPDAVGERTPAPHPAEAVVATTTVPGSLKPGASPVLQLQDAPVTEARKASPPEQIALATETANKTVTEEEAGPGLVTPVVERGLIPQRMADALEKYAAMKRGDSAPAPHGLVSVQF